MSTDKLFAQLENLKVRFGELEQVLADPSIFQDRKRAEEVSREHSELKPLVEKYAECLKLLDERKSAEGLKVSDPELREEAEGEIQTLDAQISQLRLELEEMLVPKDPYDEKDVILEIRAGTGGDEAALFAGDLLRMYTRFAENNHMKIESMSGNTTGLGGVKEISLSIHGKGAYRLFKHESGTHRVQRVPATEASGRIHTSAATVAVMPEAKEVDFQIDPKDLRIDTYRASGKGGQHVNKTDSAVRITHIPTGFAVACQDERSQHQNREKAMRLLRTRLLEQMIEKQRSERAELRKIQVGSGDRSEKIRTYNFPQDRVTDHRINFSTHNLEKILDGDLGDMIQALLEAERIRKLEAKK